jgi:3-hydroxyacyl-[acyl-carrier-protein] dehydratase
MREDVPYKQVPLGAVEIMRRIPHRYPFLMIDSVIETGPLSATALKNVSINEPYFVGHFPAEPIMPGVLLGEALAQTAAFIGITPDGRDGIGTKAFLSTLNLKFSRPVVPGDQVVLETTLVKRLDRIMKISGRASVNGATVASGELVLVLASSDTTSHR